MGLVRSPSLVLGPAAGPLVRRSRLVEEMWRYMQAVGDGASAYGTFATPVVLAGDFSIEFVYAPYLGSAHVVLSGGSTGHEVYVNADGTLAWYYNNASLGPLSSTALSGGYANTVRLTRVGSTVTCVLNGVTKSSVTVSGAVTFSGSFRRYGSSSLYAKGNLLSLSINNASTLTHYPLDGSSTLYALPAGATLGAELITNGGFDSGTSPWLPSGSTSTLSVVSGRLRITCSGTGYGAANANFAVEVGKIYVVKAEGYPGTASTYFSAGTDLAYNAYLDNVSMPTTGRAITATRSTLSITLHTGSNVAGKYSDFDNISIRELPTASILWTNLPTPKRYRAEGRAWVGFDNLVTNGGFDTDTGWTKGTGWTIASGVATHAAGAAGGLSQTALTVGARYRYDMMAALAGSMNAYAGTNFAAIASGSGPKSAIATCAGNGVVQLYGASAYTVDSVSVKHIMEPAS